MYNLIILLLISIVCFIVSEIAISWFTSLKKMSKKITRKPNFEYGELFSTLNSIIQIEFEHKINIEYKLKNIKMFYNFEIELQSLSLTILNTLSEDFLNDLAYYHKPEYIAKYVTRTCEALLIEYSRANKPKSK